MTEDEDRSVPPGSRDLVPENVARLREIFPEAFTEDGVNMDTLAQLLGDEADEGDERYGLNWAGKAASRRLALKPSTGTLRPAPEDSVDWEYTKNLFIEGDNLEVLKLLQKSYSGKVKLIYIDPPYNTGKDFVYKDDYRDNIANYLRLTGQVDEEGSPLSSNVETSGRFHTDWLNMMYPRLSLARELLREDGICCVSIGSTEVSNLIALLDDLFGESNRIGVISRVTKTTSDSGRFFAPSTDFVVCYGRHEQSLSDFSIPLSEEQIADYTREDGRGRFKRVGFYQASLTLERSPNARYFVDTPDGHQCIPPENKRWRTVEATFNQFMEDGEIEFVRTDTSPLLDEGGQQSEWNVYTKQYLDRRMAEGRTPRDFMDDAHNYLGSVEVRDLGIPFDFPKPTKLVRRLMQMSLDVDAIVVDFFAGSGTTAHAVMAQNADDGGQRRYVLVQLPEPLDPGNGEQRAAVAFCDDLEKPRSIAELTKERLRRSGASIREQVSEREFDSGFRVFKLDSTNLAAWDPGTVDLDESLESQIDPVKEGRTEDDLLFEALLKLGLDLNASIEERQVAEARLVNVCSGSLFACLAEGLDHDRVSRIADAVITWVDKDSGPDVTCVFRDASFGNESAKAELIARLEQAGLAGNLRFI